MDKLLELLNKNTDNVYEFVRIKNAVFYEKENQLDLEMILPYQKYDTVLPEIKDTLEEEIKKLLPQNVKLECTYTKSCIDVATVTKILMEFFADSARKSFRLSKFVVETQGDFAKIVFTVDPFVKKYLDSVEFCSVLLNYLYHTLSGAFEIDFVIDKNTTELTQAIEESMEVYVASAQSIEFINEKPLIGTKKVGEKPLYIKNNKKQKQDATFCGKASNIRRIESKNGMWIIYSFNLNDTTDVIPVKTIQKREKIKTIETLDQSLTEGVQLVCRGGVEYDAYAKQMALTAKYISICEIDFSSIHIEDNYKTEPKSYQVIKPYPYKEVVQKTLFSEDFNEILSDYVVGNRFVVFDLETTGLSPVDDKIVEIAAVSVENGKLSHVFETFVNPGIHIPEEASKITGITDADVANAPSIEEVLPDFYKFTRNSILVAHNGDDFDVPFVKNAAEKLMYLFNNPTIDTLILARKNLPTRKFNLTEVCKFYGIENEQAHRAISDAVATAKVFLKLSKYILEV